MMMMMIALQAARTGAMARSQKRAVSVEIDGNIRHCRCAQSLRTACFPLHATFGTNYVLQSVHCFIAGIFRWAL